MKIMLTVLKWTARIIVVAAIGLGIWQFIENRKLKAIISRPPPTPLCVLSNAQFIVLGNSTLVKLNDEDWGRLTNSITNRPIVQPITIFK